MADLIHAPRAQCVLTMAPHAQLHFAEVVHRINCGESVSGLFSDEVTYG